MDNVLLSKYRIDQGFLESTTVTRSRRRISGNEVNLSAVIYEPRTPIHQENAIPSIQMLITRPKKKV